VPTIISGNSSNKKGEFSLVKIEMAFFQFFPYITPKKDFDPILAHGQDFTKELLGETNNFKTFN
jgi:hypothetical protein